MGPLLYSCTVVHAAIELSFGMVSGVISGVHVLDGVHMPQEEGWILGSFASIHPMVWMAYFVTEMYLMRTRKVDNISIESIWTIHCWNLCFIDFPKMYLSSRSMLGFESNWPKCDSWHTQKYTFCCMVQRQRHGDQATVMLIFCWLLMYNPTLLAKNNWLVGLYSAFGIKIHNNGLPSEGEI